uniref:Uncharacterized protein n=1 Tax=Arundo donax TaxID=35708 RepID=A0A0A9E2B3_ARUDO
MWRSEGGQGCIPLESLHRRGRRMLQLLWAPWLFSRVGSDQQGTRRTISMSLT